MSATLSSSSPMPRSLAVGLLLICTILWGFAFIAQKTAMDTVGPLTFASARYLLGGLAIMPLAVWEYRRSRRRLSLRQWLSLVPLSLVFFLASWLQQAGMAFTTVTNGGFLTSLYVLFVPLIAFLATRARPHPVVWLGVPMALVGIYYLNGGALDGFNFGDLLMVSCALFWAMHVLLISIVARDTGLPIFISALSFIAVGVLAGIFAFALETPDLAALPGAWIEILYAGLFSTAVAYTLQAVGQQYVPPANAAIILSAESLFAALGGALLLGERLSPIGYAGAALIFLAIVLVETIPALAAKARMAEG